LQWAAKPTVLLLRHTVRFREPTRVLLVGTYRDSELGDNQALAETMADLRRSEAGERLSVGGLDERDVAAFIEQVGGGAFDGDNRALARAVYDETDGNPFFVKEVLRHLRETGTTGPHDIPEGVREVVGKRLSRLSRGSNAVLRTAAVVGVEFEPTVVQAAGGFRS